MNTLVSILIANFNNSKYIIETLDSVLAQTYTHWEIVIVDDASTDNSVEIINKYIAEHLDYKIELHQNTENHGVGYTKRLCIELSHGDFFAFLDPEDTITPDAIELLLNQHILQPQYSIVYAAHYLCNEKLEPQSISTWVGKIPDGQSHLTSQGGHISAFALCKRADYNKTEGINSNLQVAEDQDLYLQMEEIAPVFFVDKAVYFYRKHDNNISWNDRKQLVNAYYTLLVAEAAYHRRKKNTNIDNLTFIQIKRRRYLYYLLLFKTYYKEKKRLKAMKYLFKSLFYIYTDNHFYLLRTMKNLNG